MLDIILARLQQGHQTRRFPEEEPTLSDRFRGLPVLDPTRCPQGCEICTDACPTGAVAIGGGSVQLDLGRCLFCNECAAACPEGVLRFSREYRLAVRERGDLLLTSPGATAPAQRDRQLNEQLRRLFGRSLKLRQVSAGGCNGCEADVNVLSTVVFDLVRFGIQFVASPRHADGLLITGPVTENMRLAVKKTYDAVPDPKIVIAVGACAISGGPYIDHPEVHNGADSVVPVDLYVPGCPPHPYTILEGLLSLLGRMKDRPKPMATASVAADRNGDALAPATLRAAEAVKLLGVDVGRGDSPESHRS